MEIPVNRNNPTIMHLDLNSCFATVEQQAHSHLRGKPIVIAAYTTPNGCVLSPSIEAKRYGIKTGMTVRQARLLCNAVVVRNPDPHLVRDVHIKLRTICTDYSPRTTPKSIDEIVLDFTGMEKCLKKDMPTVGKEIKQRLRTDIGEWISCSIGIATNRFLAKLGAGLHKPDGLDIIDYQNLQSVYARLTLTDLPGINTHFEARLNANTIRTVLQFFNTPERILRQHVFQSIIGYYWYIRLRGFEIDNGELKRKSYCQDYALNQFTSDPETLSKIIMKLCEKMGRRLRQAGYMTHGVHVACLYQDGTYWHRARKMQQSLFTTHDLYTKALLIFNQQPERKKVVKLSVSCYNLVLSKIIQQSLFDSIDTKREKVSKALDAINDKYGEYTVIPALMMGMDDVVLDRIAFGGRHEFF